MAAGLPSVLPGRSRKRALSSARWLAGPLTAVVFVLGVWVAGGLLTNDFKSSMALTAAWFVLCGAVALTIGSRRRALRAPVLGGYLVSAAAVGGFLAWTTLRDKVVDERVVVGTPASALVSRGAAASARARVQLAAGRFVSLEHDSRGTAAVVRLPGGGRRLTLTHFATAAGPDLRVRIVPGNSGDGASGAARDLGALKGNKGNQQYDLPRGLDVRHYTSVVIWCRAFSAAFAKASLTPS